MKTAADLVDRIDSKTHSNCLAVELVAAARIAADRHIDPADPVPVHNLVDPAQHQLRIRNKLDPELQTRSALIRERPPRHRTVAEIDTAAVVNIVVADIVAVLAAGPHTAAVHSVMASKVVPRMDSAVDSPVELLHSLAAVGAAHSLAAVGAAHSLAAERAPAVADIAAKNNLVVDTDSRPADNLVLAVQRLQHQNIVRRFADNLAPKRAYSWL